MYQLRKKEFFKTIMIPLVLNAPEIEKWQKNIPEDKNMANWKINLLKKTSLKVLQIFLRGQMLLISKFWTLKSQKGPPLRTCDSVDIDTTNQRFNLPYVLPLGHFSATFWFQAHFESARLGQVILLLT